MADVFTFPEQVADGEIRWEQQPPAQPEPPPPPSLPSTVTTIQGAVDAFQKRQNDSGADRVPFCIPRFDRATRGGVEPGELVVQLGRTASGKTMQQNNHLHNLLMRDRVMRAYVVVTCEMPCAQLIRRQLRIGSNRTDTQLDEALAKGDVSLERFMERYRHVYFIDRGAVTLGEISDDIEDVMRFIDPIPLGGVFIDHAGLIRPEHGASGSAYERASAVGIGVKQLARRLNTAVFCIVQANRAGAKADGEPVHLEAARDSGAYEENADFVIGFGSLQKTSPGQPQPLKLRLIKNRRGPEVPVELLFHPATLRMVEQADQSEAGGGE